MRRYHPTKILMAVFIINLLSYPIEAQESPPSAGRWVPEFKQELGIKPDREPTEGEIVHFVSATVVDPKKLLALGLYGIRNGDKIKMIYLGNNQWRIKHYATGLAIILTVNPNW